MPTDRTEVKDTSPIPPPPVVGSRSWASKFRRKSEEHQHEKKKQLQDYTAWVNNYLRRKPGIPLVSDLRSNLQDGITFVNLIEIVAHVQLEGVNRYPTTSSSRRCNVERAIDFLRLEGVVFQGDPAKDILDGNSKAIMRVVLAVAERYQPRSVKQRGGGGDTKTFFSTGQHQATDHDGPRDHMTYSIHTERQALKGSQSPEGNNPHRMSSSITTNSCSVPNMVSMNIHAGAGAANNRVGVAMSGSGHGTHPIVPARSSGYAPPPASGLRKLSQPVSLSHYPDQLVEQERRKFSLSRVEGDRDDTYSTPVDTLPPNVKTRIIPPMKRTGQSTQPRHLHKPLNIKNIPETRRTRAMSSPVTVAVATDPPPPPRGDPGLYQDMNTVLSGLSKFKSELLQLHALLLKNSDGSISESFLQSLAAEFARDNKEDHLIKEDDSRSTPTGETTPLSKIMPVTVGDGEGNILESALNESAALREQLSQLQDEFTQMQSECVTLRSMLEERNTFITTMKSEIYRKEYRNDTQRVDLQNQILQKEATIKKLEAELVSIKESMEAEKEEYAIISDQLRTKEKTESDLQATLESLGTDVARLKESEDVLQAKLTNRDRKLSQMEDKMAEIQDYRNKRSDSFSEDTDNIREGLGRLRTNLSPQDPQVQIIDGLERNIAEMMSRLMERSGSPSGRRSRRHRDSEEHHRDRDRDRRKRHKEKQPGHSTSEMRTEQTTPTGGGGTNDVTKVFYYMLNDKTETPYVTLVPRRSNEITLQDFKSVFDRQGTFRFYFKTEDPDCGIVKEEITGDEQILPNWKGKILVWVSEKYHSK